MGLLFTQIQGPFIAGADWNMSVAELESSGFPRLVNITMAVPKQVTCRGGTGVSTIDYFALNDAALRSFQGVEADT
eukprot:5170161-Pyramimonas_sp.AAC.1